MDAGYPTHSGQATDYVYPSENDPFDPGIISKDSITFNPAYVSPRYPHAEAEDDAITIDGADAGEKVFYRLFYEPGYYHPIDTKMSDFYELENFNQGTPVDAVITETTYMFVNSARDPREGGPKPSDTHFMLPVRSLLEDPPGMEDGDMVDLANASCDPDQLTNGTIAVEQKLTDVPKNQWVYFMDHKIKFTGLDINENPTFSVGYVGNKVSARDEEKVKSGIVLRGDNVTYFDRSNVERDSGVSKPFTGSNPRFRWYVKVTRIDIDQVHIDFVVGRVLAAGETFYVDAMRYDMPAIYTVELDGICEFKYITFQIPIPKGEDG
ncbi:hypothetical protein KAU34_00710, partial [candidate division WOR-3 bacterium]|nr:hypothetical protein [candidate division WOR-3 bacterium]